MATSFLDGVTQATELCRVVARGEVAPVNRLPCAVVFAFFMAFQRGPIGTGKTTGWGWLGLGSECRSRSPAVAEALERECRFIDNEREVAV
jgi:hypothetical protein